MDRFVTREPGRQTRHSFSFGSFYDAARVSFGPLFALNDDLLASRSGYDEHEHADVVLVTWVVSGTLVHGEPANDAATDVGQQAGELAVTRAGTGITHTERAGDGPVRFVQAWLRPGRPGGEPSRRTTTPDLGSGDLVLVAGEDDLGVPGASLRIVTLAEGASVTVPVAPLRYVFVVTGALRRSSLAEPLAAGDAFEVTGDDPLEVTAAVPTQLLAWAFDEPPVRG
jgi:hypothetical protein